MTSLPPQSAFDAAKNAGFERRAHADAMRHIATDLPTPRAVFLDLSLAELELLISAIKGRDGGFYLPHGTRDTETGRSLFLRGLVGARTPYLGVFGMKVRRYCIEQTGDA